MTAGSDVGATRSAVAAQVRAEGLAMVRGEALRQLLDGSTAEAASLAAAWDGLEPDTHMADGGRYRRRRFAVFSATRAGIVRERHQPHFQSRRYNALNGGIERWFVPVSEDVATHPLIGALIMLGVEVFADAGLGGQAWRVEMHQFRIEALPDAAGLPTPEGMHRDGVDGVLVALVGRTNVDGGVTAVGDAAGTVRGRFTLRDPLDAVFLDDRRMWHGVTPIVPIDPARPAFRDVLVLTYRSVPDPV